MAALSDGEIRGRDLSGAPRTTPLEGRHCAGEAAGYLQAYLSEAFRKATRDTAYDTLVDVEVTTMGGKLSGCIEVRGYGVSSGSLPMARGDAQ